MDNLPLELLSPIHLALLPIPPCDQLRPLRRNDKPYRERINALTRIRLVSRRWNDIVLDTPQLWSCINIASGALWWDTTWLSLERTRGAPLHIQIDFAYRKRNDREHLIQMLKRVWSEAHRWETVAFLGVPFSPWCHLPPGPLPNLREVYIGAGRKDRVEIQAPRLEALWEDMDLTNIESSGSPALRSWGVPHPSSREECERFIKVVRNCHQLERLHFFECRTIPDEALRTLEDLGLPEASGGIYFPSLKQFEITLHTFPVNLLDCMHAPNLQRLIVRPPEHRNVPDAFSIPTRLFESSPKLDAIRFEGSVPLELIQQCLVAVPHNRIAGMEVEVEYEQWLLPQLEQLTKHPKCLDSLCRIQWIRI